MINKHILQADLQEMEGGILAGGGAATALEAGPEIASS